MLVLVKKVKAERKLATRGIKPTGNLVHERLHLSISRMLRLVAAQGKHNIRGERSASSAMEC